MEGVFHRIKERLLEYGIDPLLTDVKDDYIAIKLKVLWWGTVVVHNLMTNVLSISSYICYSIGVRERMLNVKIQSR